MFTKVRSAATLATLLSVALATTHCAAPGEEEEEEQGSSEQAIAPLAIPLTVVAAERIAVGAVLIGTAIYIGGMQLYTYVERQHASRVTMEFRSQVERDNDFVAGKYSTRLFAGRVLTPDRWVAAFGYPASAFNASRSLVSTAKDKDHRNKGGCVLASVDGEGGVKYRGGAPYTSEFDIIAAQFSAAARAYFRCGVASPDVREAWQDFIPTEELPQVDYATFMDHTVKTALLLREVANACKNPKFEVTLDKTRCR